MTLLATFKHISSKNADYGAAEAYLTFEHDEFTMKPTLDENGRLIPREDYRISSLNCGGEDFAVACMRANLRYEKNQKREDVKSHHYIISFDPRDGTDNGLTVDRAQELGEQFCKEHFPGHQALVCTHPDGHNHSGNIHVHIVINSLRIYEVPLLPYMDRPADTRAGCKHRCTNAAMEYFKSEVMEMCHREGLYQIDLLNGSKERITEREYPRTDSRHLTSDMAETASCVIHLAAKVPPFDGISNFFPLVEAMISDKDVSDHHAIIPTMEIEKADLKLLPVGERNLLLLVCCKLLCASAEPYEYEAVTATFDCGEHAFTAKGKRILAEGWREIDRIFRTSLKEKPADGDGGTLPDFTEGQTFDGAEVSVTEHFTQPPKPYTEDTLLSAMENAGKDDIPDEAERKGLGTPATRAAIIEKLVAAGFVERKGKSLIPTKAGINLVTVLPEPLTSPMLTAEWEQKLTEIAKGGADPDTFMDGIRTMVQEIVSTYSCISEDGKKLFAPEKEVIGTCPRCGQPVYEGKKNFACSDRSCGFVLWKNDRFWTSRKKELTKKMATDLLKKGRANVKGMWSEKKQATYDATVILDDTGGKYINFKLEFPKRKVGADGRK